MNYLPIIAAGACALVSSAHESPNLVLVIADQWRGSAIGCVGPEPVITPNIDRLASQGVCFTDAVSSYPVSSPARGMLLTGKYPLHSGVTGNCNSVNAPYGVELPRDIKCWSDVLDEKGYELGYIGKWHLDSPYKPYVDTYNNKGAVAWNEWCPPERRHGFRHWISYGTYDRHLNPMYWNASDTRDGFYYVDKWGPEYEADRAIEYIDNVGSDLRDKDKPFALVVSMNPPHTGYELVPDRYKALYAALDVDSVSSSPIVPPAGTTEGDFFRASLRDYYACISGVDEQVGRIIEAIDRNGIAENTIVVFTSDHGDCMGMHGRIGKNIFYEEAMRVPMIVRWTGRLKPRRDNSLMISVADLYPTLLTMMGYGAAVPDDVESMNLAADVMSPGQLRQVSQPYFLIDPSDYTSGYRGWRTNRYTLAMHATTGVIDEVLLFDRIADPLQLSNVADSNPEVVSDLTARLTRFLSETNDPFLPALADYY